MKAVNLIPLDERKGGGAGRAGRSGGAVYFVLAALALVVVVLGANAVAGKGVKDEQSKLTTLNQEVARAEAQAAALTPYSRFNALRLKRESTVKSLASSRFDWAHALHEVARVLPTNAWVTQMLGTVAPGTAVDGGVTTGASALRQGQQVPAIEITGCTTSQNSVAKMISQMRLIDGVSRVGLSQAEKPDATAAAAGGGADSSGKASDDCRNGHAHFPKFDLVVFFRAAEVTGAAGGQTAAATTPAATPTPAATTTTTPATSTPSTTTTPAGAAK